MPTNNTTLALFRAYAEARGTGWEQQDFLTTCAVQLLNVLEYGTFNTASVLGIGITNLAGESHRTGGCLTGHTTTLGNTSGSVGFTTSASDGLVAPDTATATQAMSYRGIENLYGNLTKCLDGINIKANYNPWIADHGFASATYDGTIYKNTGFTLPQTDTGGGTGFVNSSTYDYSFLPLGTDGVDLWGYSYLQSGNTNLSYGGGYNFYSLGDAFQLTAFWDGISTSGARLMYVG